ncbi:MAG: XRE family transcriptional regulator [Candidatus Nanoarchaeia archaeon]|nr:XRE family transcriptional regulator [Candidatus Nanoarchaeia archaeon]
MTNSPLVDIEPSVLKWLIDSSGWNYDELAKRLGTSTETIEKFLNKEKKPTYNQLEKMSLLFKRPVALFLLSKPLEEKPKPKDFRMIPERLNKFDKKTLLVMRKARNLQELSKELALNISNEIRSKILKYSIHDNPKEIGKKFREKFELNDIKQKKFKDAYELFRYLREVLEDKNIFAFQFSMPIEDARGFVFCDETPFVIVVNSKDTIEARIFTMMHEFAHILLRESVIDLPSASKPNNNSTEKWCNEFASNFLLPENFNEIIKDAEELTERKTLNSLSRRYKISKGMLLYNMYKLNYISNIEYNNKLNQYTEEKSTSKKSKKGGGITLEKKRVLEMGNNFISLVADNYDKKYITYSDALGYLSIKSKKFDKLLAKVKK